MIQFLAPVLRHESTVNTYLPASAQASAPRAVPTRFPRPRGSPACGYRLQYIPQRARQLRCLPAGERLPPASARSRLQAGVRALRATAVLVLRLQPARHAYAAVGPARPPTILRPRYAPDG